MGREHVFSVIPFDCCWTKGHQWTAGNGCQVECPRVGDHGPGSGFSCACRDEQILRTTSVSSLKVLIFKVRVDLIQCTGVLFCTSERMVFAFLDPSVVFIIADLCLCGVPIIA